MDGLDRWVGRKIDGQTDKQTFSLGGGGGGSTLKAKYTF